MTGNFFGGMFEGMAEQMAWQQRAKQNAQSQFDQFAYQNAPDGQFHPQPTQPQEPQGKRVTKEDENRMILLRCGNLLLDARDRGWKAKLEPLHNNYGVRHHRMRLVGPGGKQIVGEPHHSRQGAVLLGAEAVEAYL